MSSSREDDLYKQGVLGLGLATQAQIDDVLQIQSKIQQIGIRESLGDLLLKKGYLTQAHHEQVLRHLGKVAISIPGFSILTKIGQGGMGAVYKAVQSSCNRIVAIKVISQTAKGNALDVARFIREAQAAGSLHHRNLVSAIDVGFSGGHYYFVMEFVDGKSCREIVKTKGPLPQTQVLDVAGQMVEALEYIHANRMVHRDVKPENMLLTEDGVVKLCDFGLAKSIGDVDAGLTQEGFTVGTPFFMSPEQVRGDRDIDIRSDLYSLGASLFYLLAGKAPYEGKSAAETMSMHLKHPVPELHKANLQVSEDLSLLVHKLLSKERKDRYPSPRELKEDLDRIRQGSAPRHARQHGFQLQISSKGKIPQRSTVRKSRPPWPLVGAGAGGIAAVLALFGVAVFLSGPGEGASLRPAEASGKTVLAASGGQARPAPSLAPDASPVPGKAEFEEAQEIATLRPDDLAGRARVLELALRKGKDGPYAERARGELAAVSARLRKELGSIEERAKDLVAKERYKEALDLWSAVVHLHDLPTWSEAVAAKIEAIDRRVAENFAGVREKALGARDRADQAELAQLRNRTASWGLSAYISQFDALLVPPEPETPPAPAESQKPPEEKDDSLPAALERALQRDYSAAAQFLEPSALSHAGRVSVPDRTADRENLLLAGQVAREALSILAKVTRGQNLALDYADAQGRPTRVEGKILASGPGRIEIEGELGPVVVPLGELSAGTLAEVYLRQAKDTGAARKAAALFCLIEGEPLAARKLQGEPPPAIGPEYWEWAQKVSRSRSREDRREQEARRLFALAEGLHFEPAGAVEAPAKYRELQEKYGSTSFVRRNQAAIQDRIAARKDFVLSAGELFARGSWKLLHAPGKMDSLASQKDLDPAELRESYVQAEFSVLTELEYHCWVYAGACCQEVFAFSVQGDEITVPKGKSAKEVQEASAGSALLAPVKFVPPFMRRKHSEHGGQKQAEKWMWIPVPLPKYTTSGTKTLRFLTDQKGFSIAEVVVSAERQAPPKDAELRDLERVRAEEPGYASFKHHGSGPVGEIRRELWEGVRGVWVRDLTGTPNFPDRPSRVDTLKALDVPVEGTPDTGTRIRGYIHPPSTGVYVFWIAADDTGELWLSSDERPENKVLIATAPEWTGHHEWEKQPAQKSRPVTLRAGHRYYIEALEKQGGGGSHLAVGWQLPDGRLERPISGGVLSPYLKK